MAWLCLSKDHDQLVRAVNGYVEKLGQFYVWNGRVPRHRELAAGDRILLWNESDGLLGHSVIDAITTRSAVVEVPTCPRCERTDVRRRQRLRPLFRCASRGCNHEFDVARVVTVKTDEYRADYSMGWSTPRIPLSPAECRNLGRSAVSQHSIRPINLDRLAAVAVRIGI